jgi:hypothetical protein
MIVLTLIAWVAFFAAAWEVEAAQFIEKPEPSGEVELLAEAWLERLNALDDWYLSVEGEEVGVDEVVDSMMELYAPEVIANVPPFHDEDQFGPMRLDGREQLRKYFALFARSYSRLGYLHRRQTGPGFEGYKLVYAATPLPWPGQGISFEMVAAYSLRADRRQRFYGPGAVYLQYGEDGKIQRLRLLLGEIEPVVAQ